MDDAPFVHVIDCVQNLSAVEPCAFLVKCSHAFQYPQQLPSFAEIEYEIERSFVLKGVIKSDDPGVFGEPIQGIFLDVDIFDLFLFDDVSFIQDLDGILLQRLAVRGQDDGTVGSFTERLAERKIPDSFLDISRDRLPVRIDFLSYGDGRTTMLPFFTTWARAIFHPIGRSSKLARVRTRTARVGPRGLTHHFIPGYLCRSVCTIVMAVIASEHAGLKGR